MRSKGFTLIELLVVIGLITTMLVVGTVTFSAYLAETGIRLGSRTVSGAFRAARQIAVSQRVVTAVIFYEDPDENGDPSETPHRVEIRRYDAVRDDATGTLIFALKETPDEAFEMPHTLAFKWLPDVAIVHINKDDGSGTLPQEELRLIDFFPDGSSCFGGVVVDVWGEMGELPANHVAVSDLATGKLVYLYVYPVTSFIKETYVEASM